MRTPVLSLFSLLLVSSLVHCGASNSTSNSNPRIANTTPLPVESAPVAPVSKKHFENPGGMWMPQQLAEPVHQQHLKELGVQFEPKALTDPTSSILGAIVYLGGCSASFVSNEGLVVTNHHCVQGALQYNATPEKNLLKDGYLAHNKAEERWAGPTARIFVTQGWKDVTQTVLEGLSSISKDRDRYKKIEERTKSIVADCEKGKPGIRCSIAKYFEGSQYLLQEQLEIKDVRLVYAPAEGIGNYGGEIDNWRWPRHTGDFSFYRAYVGPDGKPADHSDKNIPYHPPHTLKLAKQPLQEGDFVFVAGYPARTNRLKTAAQVKDAVESYYPYRIKFFEEYLDMLGKLTAGKPDLTIKANSFTRGFNNALTNNKGQLEGLVKGGLAKQRIDQEKHLRAFIDEQPARKTQYGGALEKLDQMQAEYDKTKDKERVFYETVTLPRLVSAASTIVRMAEEREKPDAERDPDYQERNWQRHEQRMSSIQKELDLQIEKAMLGLALERASRLPNDQRPESLNYLVGKGPANKAAIEKAVERLYKTTKLMDEKVRLDLLKTATTKQLKSNPDPIIAFAVAMRPVIKSLEERDETQAGVSAVERPRYIGAMKEMLHGTLAPDANSTLRVTYGTVRSYRPNASAPMHKAFTLLPEVVAKHTGKEPFIAPEALLNAAKGGNFGAYKDDHLHTVPVDFLADLDITGGNSGSATLNANGELTGLVFDGNYESMASDWLFQPEITRSIHVDLRYMLWVMDAVDKADHLLVEMGVTPSIPLPPQHAPHDTTRHSATQRDRAHHERIK